MYTLELVYVCPVCSNERHKEISTFYVYIISQCHKCNSYFLSTRFTELSMNSIYNTQDYWKSAAIKNGFISYSNERKAIIKTSTARLHLLQDVTNTSIKDKHLLDYGGAFGYAALASKYLGAIPTVVDISDIALNECSKLGLHTLHVDDIHTLDSHTYDVITSYETIEHLYNPYETIEEFYRLLKSQGFLVLSYPDPSHWTAKLFRSKWWGWKFPDHIYLPSKKALNIMFPQDKWTLLSYTYTSQHMTILGVVQNIFQLSNLKFTIPKAIVNNKLLSNMILNIPNGSRIIILQKR